MLFDVLIIALIILPQTIEFAQSQKPDIRADLTELKEVRLVYIYCSSTTFTNSN